MSLVEQLTSMADVEVAHLASGSSTAGELLRRPSTMIDQAHSLSSSCSRRSHSNLALANSTNLIPVMYARFSTKRSRCIAVVDGCRPSHPRTSARCFIDSTSSQGFKARQ